VHELSNELAQLGQDTLRSGWPVAWLAMGLADELAPAGTKVNLPELRIVPAQHANEPLHRPREERGANEEPPVPGDDRHRPEASRHEIVDHRQLPLTASQQLRSNQRLVDGIPNREVAR